MKNPHVAFASHSSYVPVRLLEISQFLSYMADMHIDCPRFNIGSITPYVFEQLLSAEYPLLVAEQAGEEFRFLGVEIGFLAVSCNCECFHVDVAGGKRYTGRNSRYP